MFDWFWHILYQVSKTLFKIIDGLVQCANYLCGVTPVKVDGEEVDFLEYILTSDQIGFAFRVAALIGLLFKDSRGDSIAVYTSDYARYADRRPPCDSMTLTGVLQWAKYNGTKECYHLKMRYERDCSTN